MLLAASGAMLKFVAGIPYQLKVRGGMTTSITAVTGKIAFYRGSERIGGCVDAIDLTAQAGGAPYQDIDRMIRACGADAVFRVQYVR